jgi:flagellar basal body rod protein FlgG
MFRALYTAASGMETQETNLENVANNLANASTAGFRKRRMQFQDLLYQNIVLPGAASTQQTTYATGLQIGLEIGLKNVKTHDVPRVVVEDEAQEIKLHHAMQSPGKIME